MGSDIIGILDLHAKHIIFFIQQCDMVFWVTALQENTLKLFKVCASGGGWRV